MERSTRQRTAIRAAIEAAARPLSPQEILDAVRVTVPEIGIATIYRNLKLLLGEAEIQAVTLPGENPRYETAHLAHHHHHHFHCVPCDRVFEVEGCPGRMDDLAPAGFVIDRHELTLYGECAECAAKGKAKARAKAAPEAAAAAATRPARAHKH
ncbi:transcriptional repressor [Pseudoduganella umbonata]|uniref:Fur family ferric uptake transcriptional regulator n=1 Tax=Pseudoduganella umbonata TaxID=864828 RepID=A0A4P8HP51_9BURK|nr:transcriptional repressor [Pseudoduganella umbonata]MBB3221030.1 Fur family ferric uptake transcriptional regulator [Pseudoduganella umbonata]QCP10234.1 transcriptional repressor [Pseudoduganella umbonata]